MDTSPSQERVLGIEQEQAKSFVRQVLRPKDLAFLLHFDLEVEELQHLTNDQRLLARAIDETVINGGQLAMPVPGTFPGAELGDTHLHDAVYLASKDVLKNEVGRKALILLGDGVDRGSSASLTMALEAAQKADVIIYSVAIVDRALHSDSCRKRREYYHGDSVLKKLSEETGGRVIEVSRARDTAEAFKEIGEELRTQYSLGYTPLNRRRDGSFRKIRVRVRSGDYRVQARRGYYAPTG